MKIKRNNILKYFAVAGIALVFFGFCRPVRAASEAIDNFHADISVQKNGAIFVAETIVYDFSSNQKHGIFRDIPLTAANGPRLSVNVSYVRNEVGQPYLYTVSTANDMLRVKIGDPNALISGIKTYIIGYQVYNAIRTFSDHDELYWNVTGDQWSVPIQNASASVALPDASISNARMDCFTGPHGSTQKNCAFSQSGANISYSTTQSLNAGEGLTLVFGVPLGYIHNTYVAPTRNSGNDKATNILFLVFVVLVILTGVIVLLIRNFFHRRKPKPIIPRELWSRPVVIEYSPPDNLPPIEIGTLLDRRTDITDISSVIIDLAVRGYIKIRYTVEQIRFWPDKKDFELIKIKDGSGLTRPADKIIFKLLFSGRDSVKLSDLKEQKTTFRLNIKRIQEDTEQLLCDEGYFDKAAKDKYKKLKIYSKVIFLSITVINFFVAEYIMDFAYRIFPGLIVILFVLFSVIIITISVMGARLAHKLTAQGVSTLGKILGFREFLQLTEKDKLALLDAPELHPETFERFLPYAMVLGVEDKWAQKFEGMYNTTPSWYEDSTAVGFNSYTLTSNLTHFNSSFNQVFNITSPQSSSGFGGGGFSGGGSGGGGGGSW